MIKKEKIDAKAISISTFFTNGDDNVTGWSIWIKEYDLLTIYDAYSLHATRSSSM